MLKLMWQFWPVLLPVLIYLLWMLRHRNLAAQAGEDVPDWTEGPWLWAATATVVLAMIGFLILGLSAEPNREEIYSPAEFKDGELVEERFD